MFVDILLFFGFGLFFYFVECDEIVDILCNSVYNNVMLNVE